MSGKGGSSGTLYKCPENAVLMRNANGDLVCRPIGIDTKPSAPTAFPCGSAPSSSNGGVIDPMENTFGGPVSDQVLSQTKLLKSDTKNWALILGVGIAVVAGATALGFLWGDSHGKKSARKQAAGPRGPR